MSLNNNISGGIKAHKSHRKPSIMHHKVMSLRPVTYASEPITEMLTFQHVLVQVLSQDLFSAMYIWMAGSLVRDAELIRCMLNQLDFCRT